MGRGKGRLLFVGAVNRAKNGVGASGTFSRAHHDKESSAVDGKPAEVPSSSPPRPLIKSARNNAARSAFSSLWGA